MVGITLFVLYWAFTKDDSFCIESQRLADGLKDKVTLPLPLAMSDERRLERLSSMLKRRGVVLPAFDIYGGVSGLIDYGPVGAAIRRRLTQKWVNHWLSHGDIVEIDLQQLLPNPYS